MTQKKNKRGGPFLKSSVCMPSGGKERPCLRERVRDRGFREVPVVISNHLDVRHVGRCKSLQEELKRLMRGGGGGAEKAVHAQRGANVAKLALDSRLGANVNKGSRLTTACLIKHVADIHSKFSVGPGGHLTRGGKRKKATFPTGERGERVH